MTTPLLHPPVALDREPFVAGAQAIIDAGLWCVVEVCLDVPAQRWEPRLLVCRDDVLAVARTAAEWTCASPDQDVRLAGYTRDTLVRVDEAPAPLCHVAGFGCVAPPAQGG